MGKRKTRVEGQVDEYLDAVGQEDEEKAAKWVIEVQDQVAKKNKNIEGMNLEKLEKSRRRKFDYLMQMVQIAEERFKLIDWPNGFVWKLGIKDEDKMHLMFKDAGGHVYGRGIKCTGMQVYDLNAINVIATQAENTVDRIMNPAKTESGIYLK